MIFGLLVGTDLGTSGVFCAIQPWRVVVGARNSVQKLSESYQAI